MFVCLKIRRPPTSKRTEPPFPYTTLFRSNEIVFSMYAQKPGRPAPEWHHVKTLSYTGIDKEANIFSTTFDSMQFSPLKQDVHLKVRWCDVDILARSEEHTSELQSLMRTTYAVSCLKKKNPPHTNNHP